jgi:hypothetical protein
LHLLKIHSRGAPITPQGCFGPLAFIILKSSYQDLSNEGSKLSLSPLELVFKAAQKWAFLDKFWILAGLNRAQKNQSSEFTEFSTKT